MRGADMGLRHLICRVVAAAVLGMAAPAAGVAASGEPPAMAGVVEAHNAVRRMFGVAPLTWSDAVAAVAADWARTLSRRGCIMEHRAPNRYGENLAWFKNMLPKPADVVTAWAEERADYDHARKQCRPGKVCGHYTQILDRRSRRVGCAMARCGNREEVWVCNYDPPGNVIGVPPY